MYSFCRTVDEPDGGVRCYYLGLEHREVRMKVSIKDLRRRDGIIKVIIESVDLSIYIAHAVIDGREYLVSDVDGSVLKTRNLMAMKEQLEGVAIREMVLQQRSAYDEMIGHSAEPLDNAMEVRLSADLYPVPKWLQ